MDRRGYQDRSAADRFVGRGQELTRIVEILRHPTRLLTLVGPGGIGKTRLAAEAVRTHCGTVGQPMHWVRLARLETGSPPATVEHEVAQAVVGNDFSNRSAAEAVIDTLNATPAVLVLDNCEHVVPGVGQLITNLLDNVADITIVATSRRAIGWIDEQRITVPPLTDADAVALFRQRAELTGEPLTRDDAATVAAICLHLDNHPLFIRLAAARLSRRSTTQILVELSGKPNSDQRLRWADGPRFGADSRHRAVSDVIEWSYGLCSPEERLLFDRMSVFAAGYVIDSHEDPEHSSSEVGVVLETVQAVCADDATATLGLASDQIPALLDKLVDHSLVSAQFDRATLRYSLVESLRIFAAQRLQRRSAEEPARLIRRYIHYYRDKVAYAAAHWSTPAGQHLLDWTIAAWDNIRTVLELSTHTPGEAITGLEICAGVFDMRLPFVMGSFREERWLAERALHVARALDDPPAELQISVLASIARIAVCQGDLVRAARFLDDCVAVHLAANRQALQQDWRGTAETDIGLPAVVEVAWAHELFVNRDPRSVTVLQRAGQKYARVGDLGGTHFTDVGSALFAALVSPPRDARVLADRVFGRTDTRNPDRATAWGELVQAMVLTKAGDPEAALELQTTAINSLLTARDFPSAAWALYSRTWALAQLLADLTAAARPDRARITALAEETAQALGAARAFRISIGMDFFKLGPLFDESERATTIIRNILGADRYREHESIGAQTRPELRDLLLFASSTGTPRRDAGDAKASWWKQLTKAEQDVAVLAANGLTNAAIAAHRGTARKTVDAQIVAILHKLSISSRAQIQDFIPEKTGW
ncbi:ATP-binding protein [Nocardia sp. NPDC052566]|uniref:ATP-binding protein n=1 Tax=Nocardia sp. NPDC052566 TaxID=3364330 RepID=UPI0037C8C2CC